MHCGGKKANRRPPRPRHVTFEVKGDLLPQLLNLALELLDLALRFGEGGSLASAHQRNETREPFLGKGERACSCGHAGTRARTLAMSRAFSTSAFFSSRSLCFLSRRSRILPSLAICGNGTTENALSPSSPGAGGHLASRVFVRRSLAGMQRAWGDMRARRPRAA